MGSLLDNGSAHLLATSRHRGHLRPYALRMPERPFAAPNTCSYSDTFVFDRPTTSHFTTRAAWKFPSIHLHLRCTNAPVLTTPCVSSSSSQTCGCYHMCPLCFHLLLYLLQRTRVFIFTPTVSVHVPSHTVGALLHGHCANQNDYPGS